MNLEKYIRTMKEAYRKAYSTYETARMDKDIALENLEQKAAKGNLSLERVTVQREDIENKFSAVIEQIRADVQAAVDEQSAGFNAEVCAFYAPDGSKIDLNDMNLIKSGLKLSIADIWNRIIKYADNVTMLQIFQKYVVENKIPLNDDEGIGKEISAVFRRVYANGKSEISALKSFIQLAGAGMPNLGATDSYDKGTQTGAAVPDAYYMVLNKLDEYELLTQIRILEARPVIGEDVQKEINSRETEITRLQEARGMKKTPKMGWRNML